MPTESQGPHYQGDVRDLLDDDWDLMVAHPPCDYLAICGARWHHTKIDKRKQALDFVRLLLDSKIPRIALENPVSIISSKIRKPDQVIQPYQFGHYESKRTCLWLKNLPKLKPTNIVSPNGCRVHRLSPGKNRKKYRQEFHKGIAEAMAEQWGKIN